ncbi:MAG: Gfo/Idh/MocA family oxidoreductase [Actinomycetota bacterium]
MSDATNEPMQEAGNGSADPGRPVRYGVVGTGMMGIEHIHNIRAFPSGEVVAISDPTEASRAAGLEACGREVAVYADHRELLADPEVEAVVVASPNHTHEAILDDVLRAGRHVLIEKPLCTTVEACRSVMATAKETAGQFPDRVVHVGLEYRYMPAVARLIEEVGTGVLGRPRMVAIREHRFPFLVKVDNWNRFSANTGGTLVEKCCHFFDLMNLIVGERPTRVMASGAQDVNHLDEVYGDRRPDILDNAYVIVDYPGGARAMLDLCMFADASHHQEEISVVGADGKAEAFLPEGRLRVGIRGKDWIGDVPGEIVDDSHIAYEGLHHGSSYLEHIDFVAAIRGEAPVPVTLEDGLWSVAIGVAAHRSIDEGRPVELREVLHGAAQTAAVTTGEVGR